MPLARTTEGKTDPFFSSLPPEVIFQKWTLIISLSPGGSQIPRAGRGWGEEDHSLFTSTLTLPHQGGGYNLVVFIVQEVTHPLRSIAQKTTLRDSEFSV